MKTYLIALAASAAFATAALAGEMPNTDPNMQPAPAATAAPATTESAPAPAPLATTASTPDVKEEVAPATAVSMPDDKAKTEDKPLTNEKPAQVQKKVAEHHVKYHNGEGSTWKTGRNSYGFEGTYGGCQIRGSAGPNGYHIDRAC